METNSSVAAVLSLYNPSDDVVGNCTALIGQVGHVVAVDDGSTQDVSGILAQLEHLGVTVVRMGSNSGIASALNAGIHAAVAHSSNPRFIMTMDQDSHLEPEYTTKLLSAYADAIAHSIPVALVAPGIISGLSTRHRGHVQGIVLGGEPIQSGLLIPVEVLDKLGPLMDELFIDGVDTEYYLRARNAGMECVLAPDARLGHALGAMVTASLFRRPISIAGRPLRIRTAADFRYYYIFRNRLLLVRRYWRSQPAWAVKAVLADYRHLAIVTVLAPQRIKRLVSAIAGIRDGISKIGGPRQILNSHR
ncbi:glycosyltransferase [Specibacter sp. NPDC057265]|uniref:glycosyltransferase n=1 Tax=Specibacter sp. NPDC057265 TaxID=3346075 RepID=UPI00363ED811